VSERTSTNFLEARKEGRPSCRLSAATTLDEFKTKDFQGRPLRVPPRAHASARIPVLGSLADVRSDRAQGPGEQTREKSEDQVKALDKLTDDHISKLITSDENERGLRRHRTRCECGGFVTCEARAPRAKRGFRNRPKHDLCRRCYRSLLDRLAIIDAASPGPGLREAGDGRAALVPFGLRARSLV